jgi:hypothetical protein
LEESIGLNKTTELEKKAKIQKKAKNSLTDIIHQIIENQNKIP